MAKEEKLLKKLDKILKAFGVEDEEDRKSFLEAVQDKKYDEEEIVEENNEKVEEPTEPIETEEKVEEKEEVEEPTENLSNNEEPEKEEIVEEEKVETETPNEEEVAEEGEEVVEEEVQPELPFEEEQVDQPQEVDAVETLKGQLEEMKKSNEGLVARLEQLENIISKLGVPTEEQFGESPMSQKGLEDNSDMAEINRKRLGY